MLNDVVQKYLKIFPKDRQQLDLLLDQLKKGEKLDNRKNFRAHIAGDAIILSPDHKKILFIFHQHSGRWQQPGGHWDEGEDGPWLTAEREAFEETGVKIAERIGPEESDYKVPLHIITGPVFPSVAKKEPHHWHHDFRYGFIAKSEDLGEIQDEGIKEAKWLSLEEAIKMKDSGHETTTSIKRLLQLLN